MKINVLGTEYTIYERTAEEDKTLNTADGYCDKTTKVICVTKKTPDSNLGDWETYRKKVLRHEIIHAFLFESGLHENFEHKQWGHDETFIDWIANQFPKMQKAFEEAGCL